MDALQQLNIAAPVADIFNRLEYDIIIAIARQLSMNPDKLINHTSEWRIQMLARMGKVTRETARYIAQQTKDVPGDVEAIIEKTISAVLTEHGLEGNTSVIGNVAKAIEAFDHQAITDKYNQVNTVMTYRSRKAYVDAVNSVADKFEKKEIANKQEYLDIFNKNAMEVTLGEKSRSEAIRDTIREMSDKGIPAFVDAAHHEWSPEAYINMDIRNTAKNAALMAEFESAKELGQDVILVSSHAAARPLCAPYQGKFYSLSGKAGTITDAYGKEYTYEPLSSTSYGQPAGLFGINCGHTFRGVDDGLFVNNEETYSEKENSEEYEKVQKQRALERDIRKNKMKRDALRAAGDEEGAKEYDRKVREGNKRLNDYCAENRLTVRNDRTQVYGYKDGSKKTQPKEFVQILDKSEDDDIMEVWSPSKITQNSIYNSYEYHRVHNGLNKTPLEELTDKDKILGVDYGNLPEEVANSFSSTLSKLSSEYDTPLQTVRVMTKEELIYNAKAFAGVSHDYNEDSALLVINPRKCGNYEDMISRIKKLVEDGEFVDVSEDKLPEYIATHEFGHTLLNVRKKLNPKTNWVNADYNRIKQLRKSVEDVYSRYMSELQSLNNAAEAAQDLYFETLDESAAQEMDRLYDELKNITISKYSKDNVDEFLAEAFTQAKIGKTHSKYSDEIITILDEAFRRH